MRSAVHTGGSQTGDLDTRQLSCYSCSKCKGFDCKSCENKACFGEFKGQKLQAKSKPTVPQTRAKLVAAGLELAKQCKANEVT